MQLSVFKCIFISMSYHYIKYEFLGTDSAGFRCGEVQFQVSEFFEPLEAKTSNAPAFAKMRFTSNWQSKEDR